MTKKELRRKHRRLMTGWFSSTSYCSFRKWCKTEGYDLKEIESEQKLKEQESREKKKAKRK